MNTLCIERSSGGGKSGEWVSELDLSRRPDRIIVGTGPGSFAGVRSALAFAQGYAIGSGCEVLGLPSACALALPDRPTAVVGDARRGKAWIALFDGLKPLGDVFLADAGDVAGAVRDGFGRMLGRVPDNFVATSPDDARIGGLMREAFGDRYDGGRTPVSEGLLAFAEACPSALRSEPLPVYLTPAVRD